MRRKFLRHRLALGEFLEDAAQDGLHRGKHVVLLDEAHLQVELVELAGQPVGARILVTEAGRHLEVAVEARCHDQLLVLLRSLRQGVELALVDARRHEEVACAFRRGGRQDRRRELREARLSHQPAHGRDDTGPFDDVRMQRLAAQVEEAVFEANVLRIVGLAEHRQRQFLRRRQHLDLAGIDLDLAGRHVRVHRLGRSGP